MARLRDVRKYGNSLVIALFKSDVKDFGIKVGDLIDIEDIKVSKKTKNGKE